MDITYLNELFKLCIVPILGAVATFVVFWIKAKTKELQAKTDDEKLQSCLSILEITVTNAVIATNQTYVEALKDKNAFSAEAQEEAFRKTYDAVINSLTEDAKTQLATITTDLTTYITEMIEAKVNEQKKEG